MRFFLLVISALFLMQCDFDDDIGSKVDPSDVISLTFSQEEGLVADGSTVVTVYVKIPRNAEEEFREITLSTQAGLFVGPSEAGNTTSLIADANGMAEAILELGFVPGTFMVEAKVGSNPGYTASKQIIVGPFDFSNLLTLSVSDTIGLLADGVSIFQIDAHLESFEAQQLNLVGTNGVTFINNSESEITVSFDLNNNATIIARVGQLVNPSPIVGQVTISSTTTIENSLIINPNRALPDDILIDPSSTTIGEQEQITLTVLLIRDIGKVSENTAIKLTASQTDSLGVTSAVGRFSPLQFGSDASGKVVVNFFIDNSPNISNNPIRILASSPDQSGNIVVDSVLITPIM